MPDYEIRLLDSRNQTVLSYCISAASDEVAKQTLASLNKMHYARYEIWRDPDLIDTGYKTADGTASAA